jgi:hypothetical protein
VTPKQLSDRPVRSDDQVLPTGPEGRKRRSDLNLQSTIYNLQFPIALLVWLGTWAINNAAAANLDHRGGQFFGWDDFGDWARSPGSKPAEMLLTSPEVSTQFAWDQLVASWNVETPPGAGLKVEARALHPDHATKFYTLGLWSSDPAKHPRESVRGQKDQDGDVLTDTLVLSQPCHRAQLRVTLVGTEAGSKPRLGFVGLSLLDSKACPPALPPERAPWGKTIPVPQRSQVNYPGGVSAWCSPTAVSMVLAYWAGELKRPELDQDVPAVVEGVFDRNWPGTGNWAFNTAFAGSLPGMRAYVTRLSDVSELEAWLAHGIPVVVSVSYDLLRGKPKGPDDAGHLVVCVGFTAAGDVMVNDPGASKDIRRTFPRKDLVAAWANSHNTVYLIHPIEAKTPPDRFEHWHTGRRGPTAGHGAE